MNPAGLEGRVALVTGGSRGIGLAVARGLVTAGATVAVASRAPIRFDNTVPAYRLDVADEENCKSIVRACQDDFGHLDIVINGAGIATSSPFLSTSTTSWKAHFAVDVDGPFFLIRAALPGMLQQGWGRVISIGSIAGRVGFPYVSAYSAAKHALLGLTRSLAAEHARSGVTFNCVCPFYVDTPMTDATIANIVKRTGRTVEQARQHLHSPQGRLIATSEIADLCVYLASDSARSVTGQAWNVDGGHTQS